MERNWPYTYRQSGRFVQVGSIMPSASNDLAGCDGWMTSLVNRIYPLQTLCFHCFRPIWNALRTRLFYRFLRLPRCLPGTYWSRALAILQPTPSHLNPQSPFTPCYPSTHVSFCHWINLREKLGKGGRERGGRAASGVICSLCCMVHSSDDILSGAITINGRSNASML